MRRPAMSCQIQQLPRKRIYSWWYVSKMLAAFTRVEQRCRVSVQSDLRSKIVYLFDKTSEHRQDHLTTEFDRQEEHRGEVAVFNIFHRPLTPPWLRRSKNNNPKPKSRWRLHRNRRRLSVRAHFLIFFDRHGGFTGRPSSFSSTWRSNDFVIIYGFLITYEGQRTRNFKCPAGGFPNGILFRFYFASLALMALFFCLVKPPFTAHSYAIF